MVPRAIACLVAAFLMVPAIEGCSTNHEFRVASVGDTSAQASPGSTAVNGSAPLIIAAGNVLIGPGSKLALTNGILPTNGTIDGTVSAILLTTDQTLVQLANGSSVLLNGVGGALGDAVSIDLGQGRVVGGPNSLIGSTLTGSPTGGSLVTLPIGATNPIGNGSLTSKVTSPVKAGTSTVTGTLNGVLSPTCC